MPWRARICDWRYSGQWSAYFATSTCATSRSVGKPPAISLAGAAACTTPSWQVRQAYFGRRVTSTRYCAGITSSRDERSSPITCIAPPQQRQAVSSGSMTISTRGRCSGSEPRPARRVSVRARLTAGLSIGKEPGPRSAFNWDPCSPTGASRQWDSISTAVLEAPALVTGFDDVAVMSQSIQQRGCHFGIAEDARPFGEGEIGRDDDRGALV